jgi:hypothetical protein
METATILFRVNTTIRAGTSLRIGCEPRFCLAVVGISMLALAVILSACEILMPWGLMLEAHLETTGFACDLWIGHFFFIELSIFTAFAEAPAEVRIC